MPDMRIAHAAALVVRVDIHDRSDGIHLSNSKRFTARRCSAVSSGGSITVGRRPIWPVVVRTSVALIPASDAIISRAEAWVPSAIFTKLTSISPITVANV